jgi:hypothetical protein
MDQGGIGGDEFPRAIRPAMRQRGGELRQHRRVRRSTWGEGDAGYAAHMLDQESKRFFFKKKNQKTFFNSAPCLRK